MNQQERKHGNLQTLIIFSPDRVCIPPQKSGTGIIGFLIFPPFFALD